MNFISKHFDTSHKFKNSSLFRHMITMSISINAMLNGMVGAQSFFGVIKQYKSFHVSLILHYLFCTNWSKFDQDISTVSLERECKLLYLQLKCENEQ